VSTAPTVRVDILIWLALIAAAAALRLVRLDALPLTFDESARAFEALRVSQNSVPEGWRGDLAGAAASYLFRLFGESDFLARVVPAAAGAAMVATVWLCGRALGRVGALVAGALLAFSPLAVVLSRSALPFSTGGLLAVAMVAALFSYLNEPRAHSAFLFAVAFGLAPSTDIVATTAAIAVVAFLLLEPIVREDGAVARAWGVFRRSPSHWLSVVLVLVAALQLGFTHFGTSVDRLGLAGLSQWSDAFALPRDGREPEYQLALLLGYDWPALLFGAVAAAAFVWRLVRGGAGALSSAQLFLLVWAGLAALTVGLATQREAGQTLALVLPLAMLAGVLAEEVVPSLDWGVLARWWPAVVAALVSLAIAALVTTEWSQGGIEPWERFYLVLALGGAAVVLAACYSLLGRDAAAIGLTVAAAVSLAFLAHGSISLARDGGAAEFAVDVRTSDRIGQFHDSLREVAATRSGPLLVDPSLSQPLAWYLRDLPAVFAEPAEGAGTIVTPADRPVVGFTSVGDEWRLGESWYPVDLDILPLWRWLVYRQGYGNLNSMEPVEAQILVPAP
jgi:uncharacterized protein (TIGR03663 family)